jgi:uncharacterized protein (TIGR03435 family)
MTASRHQHGLMLESTRASIDVLVIDKLTKPREN